MKNNSQFHTTQSGLISQWLTACCLLGGLLISACASNPDREARISLLDFKTQNFERLRSGIEVLEGNDNAGRTAMEFRALNSFRSSSVGPTWSVEY